MIKLTPKQIEDARALYNAVLKAEQTLINAEEDFADSLPDGVQPHDVMRLLKIKEK